ncbi:hypothetical protein AVEN_260224-1 [Araneus ventricosus]|uniref:Tc1-like transposase DDE domain-containing protein n=1 Tax=Araneus ventricosus TaxID=182803 RepID=A0A4Y2TWL2_ARAVE|nr:hypothetical protein AVEN_226732-1 [Araneus ventricosus]GBO03737.1 hypothetical protein AVEN_260224-1 [Araneus ventricosus]
MTGNTLLGLTSLVPNCIGRMHVYEYEDNINNPYWIIHPVCQQGTVLSGGASVMVWDVCSWRDMGPLIRLETTLRGGMYLSILSDHLYSCMSIVHSDGLGQFQQDNATLHASRVATKWLQEHSFDFRHFHWPPKSPEMNITEDIRDCLLYAVENRSPPPRTPIDLLTALQNSWCEFPPGYLQTQPSPCHVVLRHFCVLVGARHNIKKVYQFFWLFSVLTRLYV